MAAFDVQGGGGLSGFACGSLVTDAGTRFFTDREDMQRSVMTQAHRRAWTFCHGLQYDLPLLEGERFPSGSLLFTRYNLLWATYTIAGRKFKLYDSLNLFPRLSTINLAEMVQLRQEVLPLPIRRQLAEGRPWSHFSESDQALIKAFSMREAEILYAALQSMQEIALTLGGSLRPTISGMSMDIFRRRFMQWPWPVVGPKTNALARPAFYGGRVENFAYGQIPGVNLYDVNSLYPFVQSQTKFPHPHYLRLEIGPRSLSPFSRWEGVCQCTLMVPDRFVPPLPYRFDKRLFFPFGRMSGCWTLAEIRHALETGCILDKIEWVLGSPVLFNPFVDFVETLYHARSEFRNTRPEAAGLVKLLLNSLYGRWGLNPAGGLSVLVNLDTPDPVQLNQGARTFITPFGLYAYQPLETTHQPDYVNVLIAAQIAGAARLHLLDELEYQNEQLAYCDTDSVITRGQLGEGQGLGAWRLEMSMGSADLVSPKDYSITPVGGDIRYTTKGVPVEVSAEYFTQGMARFRRALSVREAIQAGRQPTEWVQTYKSRGYHLPKRQAADPMLNLSGGWTSTAPYSTSQLAEVVMGRWPPSDFETFVQVPLLPEAALPVQLDLLGLA